MNRILIMSYTPYQLMTAMRIIEQFHTGDIVDIALSRGIANVDVLTSALKEIGLFRNIYTIDKYERPRNRFKKNFYECLSIHGDKYAGDYSIVYFSNIGNVKINYDICKLKKINRNLSVRLYEDGFATYSIHFGDFFESLKQNNILKRCLNRIKYNSYLELEEIYVYSPEIMAWSLDGTRVRQIKKIASSDVNYISMINKVFGYNQMTDSYDSKVVFFEESYYADNIPIDDKKIVDFVAECVGKNNLFVKIHPRNPVNRFKESGYKTNEITTIPWEVIALNLELSDKILMTIASGSALTSLVNMSSAPRRIIMLMDCNEIDQKLLTPTLPILKMIALHYPLLVSLPTDLQSVESELRNIL